MTTWNGGHSLEVLTLALQGEILDLVSITEVPNSRAVGDHPLHRQARQQANYRF